jgi:hypothetical protein
VCLLLLLVEVSHNFRAWTIDAILTFLEFQGGVHYSLLGIIYGTRLLGWDLIHLNQPNRIV